MEFNNFNTEEKHFVQPAEGSEVSFWRYNEGASITLLSNTFKGSRTFYKDDNSIIEENVPFEINLSKVMHDEVTRAAGYEPI